MVTEFPVSLTVDSLLAELDSNESQKMTDNRKAKILGQYLNREKAMASDLSVIFFSLL
jgi:hypothetical protein